MDDDEKTKAQLIAELRALRQTAESGAEAAEQLFEQRQRSMARVRAAIGEMKGSADMGEVLVVFREELRRLEVPFDSCGVSLVEEAGESTSVHYHSMTRSGEWVPPAPDHPGAAIVRRIWRAGEVAYRRDLEAEDLYGERPQIELDFGQHIRCVVDVPFAQGTLAVNSAEPAAFNPTHIQLLQEMAQILAEGFKRMEDLRVLEGRNQELVEERNLLRAVLDNVPVDVYVKDLESRFIMANANAMRALRVETPEEFVGKTDFDFMPQDPAMAQGYFDDEQEVMRTGRPLLNNEQSGTDPDGAYLTAVANKVPLRDADGAVVGILGVSWDITERKRMEEELRKTQNLESLGILAGGIAHDFNNLLTGVTINLSLLMTRLQEGGEDYAIAADAERAAERGRDLAQQLMTFASGGAPVKKTTSVEDLVKEAATLSLPGSKSKPVYRFAADLRSTDVDRGQISQVVQNLVINADQAMPNGGLVEIAAENADLDEHNPLALEPGPYVRVAVRDQGTGMSEEVMRQVFDPYFTTKQAGHGLGLSISYSIIARHGGAIGVDSAIDVGTTFDFYLPASTQQTAESEAVETELPTGTGRILVMDDEEIVRATMRRALGGLGYEVELVADGRAALAAYGEAPYDLVIMDLTIPGGMGGKEAIAELLAVDPGARVLVTSGYADDPIMASYADYGFCGRMVKPVRMQELAAAVRDGLEA